MCPGALDQGVQLTLSLWLEVSKPFLTYEAFPTHTAWPASAALLNSVYSDCTVWPGWRKFFQAHLLSRWRYHALNLRGPPECKEHALSLSRHCSSQLSASWREGEYDRTITACYTHFPAAILSSRPSTFAIVLKIFARVISPHWHRW